MLAAPPVKVNFNHALKRAIRKDVYIYLPFGVCFRGFLYASGGTYSTYVVSCFQTGTSAKFKASDVVAVNKHTGLSFALCGSNTTGLATGV